VLLIHEEVDRKALRDDLGFERGISRVRKAARDPRGEYHGVKARERVHACPPGYGGKQYRASARDRARHQYDPATVNMVGHISPEGSYRYCGYRLDKSQPSETERAVRYLVDLETYDNRERPAGQGKKSD
jgi:hypothetical protein